MFKLKHRILALLLVLTLVCGNEMTVFAETDEETSVEIQTASNATVLSSGNCGSSGVTYKCYSDGRLVISGNGEINGWSPEAMPWRNYKDSIHTLIIEEGITKLGYQSFIKCTGLTSISLPTTLKTTDQSTFSGCTNIKNIYIKDITSYLNISWAYGSKPYVKDANLYLNGELVTDLIIPSGTTEMSNGFQNIASIKSVTFPKGVTSIGYGVMHGCKNLSDVTISDDVTTISYNAFKECSSLESIVIPDSVTIIKSDTFMNCTALTDVTLSKNITEIASNLFYGCTSLEEIEIPGGVTSIDSSAFYDCTNLSTIKIPGSVTAIKSSAFYNCDKLAHVFYDGTAEEWANVSIAGYNYGLEDAIVHFKCDGVYTSAITEPTCKETGYTTYACTCGEDTQIKDEVPVVDEHDWDEGVVTTEPTTTTEGIKTYTCTVCGETKEEKLPTNDIVARGKCGYNLTWKLNLDGILTISGSGEMYDYSESYDDEKGINVTSAPWASFTVEKLILENGITKIGESAFSGCSGFKGTLVIPDSVISIGQSAFANCAGFTGDLIIPESVEYIGNNPFDGINFESVKIENASCEIYDHRLTIPASAIIYGYFDSTAYEYALIYHRTLRCIEHSWNDDYTVDVDANCTETGSKSIHCANCDMVKDVTEIPVTHAWNTDFTVDQEADCEEDGSKSIHCKLCSVVKDVTVIGAYGHTEVIDEAVPPTATETGLTQGSHCSKCGEILVAQEVISACGAEMSETEILLSSYVENYTGDLICPAVTVILGSKVLVENEDYTVEYTDNKNIGRATVTINGNGL